MACLPQGNAPASDPSAESVPATAAANPTPATDGSATAATRSAEDSDAEVPLQVILVATDMAVGRERFAFALMGENNTLLQDAETSVTFFKLSGDVAQPVASGSPVFYASPADHGGVYVIRADFDTPGPWGAEIRANLAGGRPAVPQRVAFQVQMVPKAPGVGDTPPATANRTLAGGAKLTDITSDPSPDPDLYALTVDEAARSGRPTVILFSSPAYCSSRLCGPVTDEIKSLKNEWGDQVNFIHLEVFKSFQPLVTADEMLSWGLSTEPWVFVLDSDGKVADRLEGNVTRSELAPILTSLTDGRS